MLINSLKKLYSYLGQQFTFNGTIRKFCVDSRFVEPGDLYFALPGEVVHGESFVQEALNRGAIAAVVSNSYIGPGALIHVEDVLRVLQNLAKTIFEESRPKHVIAITGSLGKTTTKEFLATFLEDEFSVFKTPGNANSKIGLPLAILNHFKGQDVAILEMGMTHAGQIKSLISLFPPDIALITKVALVHAANFDSLEGIIAAKGEIFLSQRTVLGIIPFELNEYLFQGDFIKKTFGLEHANADFSFVKYKTPTLFFNEPHLIHNLLGAFSVALSLGIDVKKLFKRFSLLKLPAQRMEKIKKNGVIFVNDAYNAAPESVIAALKALPKPEKGKKRIAVLGEMRELGRFSEECHRKIGIEALALVDHMICYGEQCTPLKMVWEQAKRSHAHLKDHAEIVEHLKALVEPGDVVLLKGSNSTKMWTILDKL